MYIALMGCAQQGSSSPLALTIQENQDPNLLVPGASGSTQQTNAGEVDVTGIASGGSPPYSFAWTVTEVADGGNCVVLAAGTQNAAQYNTLTFQTVIPSGFPPETQAEYELECTVTDSAGASVQAQIPINVISIAV